MNKRLYAIHGWMGLNLGLLLFVICLSGTIAVLSHEIDWLVTPAMRVTPTDERVDWTEMTHSVRQAYPDAEILGAAAPLGSRFASEFSVRTPGGLRERVYVDPYSGMVTGRAPWFNSQRFFRDFHRRFFISAWWGIWLVTIFAFVLLASAATGLVFHKRWWTKLFVLRLGKGLRVFFSDLHRMTGVWTLLFAVLIGITGGWYMAELPVNWAGLTKTPDLPRVSKTTLDTYESGSERLPPQQWVRIAEQAMPGLNVRLIGFPTQRDRPAHITGQASAWLVRDRANQVLVDPFTGEVLFQQRAEELGGLLRWVHTADELHFGTFGGLTTKLIWFTFGLVLSGLIPIGAYLWVRRRQQMVDGIQKRFEKTANGNWDVDRAWQLVATVQKKGRRNSMVGLLSTFVIYALAMNATWGALAKQLDDADRSYGWQAIGAPGAIVVYSSFLLLLLVVSVIWYRWIWNPPLPKLAR